ncbi:hypothetical protein FBZ89_110128 [Nitrospirillum amazonense]|uniref:Carbon monoxide dehydrogenase subunit G n=1 Tax=Nitrospirillum amazonense TaxID=28077 RepID=A0A560FA37_9PROT|nr:hypothetical protein [Nitrospirillum amazonense]TWB18479.1 hypothetical protein FBZ89_110128 [Nitrospirillum amazonense]
MDISGEYLVAAPQDLVWVALNDAEVLRQSVPPGYDSTIALSDLDPPHGCVLHGDGQQAAVRLVDAGDGQTRLIFNAAVDADAEADTRAFFAQLAGLLATAATANPALVADVALAEPAVDAAAIAEAVPEEVPVDAKPKRTRTRKAAEGPEAGSETAPKRARKPKAEPAPAESIPLVELAPLTEAMAPTLVAAAQDGAARDELAAQTPEPATLPLEPETHARAIEHQVRPTEAEALGSAGISLPPEPAAPGPPADTAQPAPTMAHPVAGLRPMIWIPLLVLVLLLLIVLIR